MHKHQLLHFLIILVIATSLLLSSCSGERDVVNIYSGRHYQIDENLFRDFERETGIRVNLIKADTDQLINRLEMEGNNSPADIFITADAGRMIMAMDKGLLQPMDVTAIKDFVPSGLRDPDNYWTGITKRARVLVYDPEKVDLSELSTYEDLVLPHWQGRILVRSSQNHYNQTLMASIIAEHGEEKAREWAAGIVDNMARPPRGNDRDQVKAIAAGEGDVAIVNTYYMGLLLNSTNREERNIAGQMKIFFPNQQDRGTHINISGIAIAAYAPNAQNAQKLIEYLLSKESQEAFANNNFEYPVRADAQWIELFNEWGDFKSDTLPLDQLGAFLSPATIVFNQAGWN